MAHAQQQYKRFARGALIDFGVILALLAVAGIIFGSILGLWAAILLVPMSLGALYVAVLRLFRRVERLVDEKIDAAE